MTNFYTKSLVCIITSLCLFVIVSCEDDALLDPVPTDDCTGSYCNLSLPGTNDYALRMKDNPKAF